MYPGYRDQLIAGDDNYLTMFAQEIRRFYPFGPFLGARVRNEFHWHSHHFKKGDLVFLDIYGTNHDPLIWNKPNEFCPEHFARLDVQPFDFIPQGGGDAKSGTRCPGEWLVVELLKVSMDFLAKGLEYEVPLQDLSYRLNRIPAIPKSRFIMTGVRNKGNYNDLP
jgi:fatty-acid peroxygenase